MPQKRQGGRRPVVIPASDHPIALYPAQHQAGGPGAGAKTNGRAPTPLDPKPPRVALTSVLIF